MWTWRTALITAPACLLLAGPAAAAEPVAAAPAATAPVPETPSGPPASPGDWTSPTVGLMKWIPSSALWLMEHEVTQGEWQAVMGSNPVATGTKFAAGVEKGSCASAGVGATRPVACVSWTQAVEFAARASARDGVTYRLPTEQEWEAAARGGESHPYAGSDDLDAVGWYDGNSGSTMHPTCQKQRNAHGLCDMSGNVWEWTATEEGANRVLRGGSWSLSPPRALVASRYAFDASDRYFNLGFRLARSGP